MIIDGTIDGTTEMPKLTARRVDALKEPGMYSDGEGLYLRLGQNGGKSWILRTVVYGR